MSNLLVTFKLDQLGAPREYRPPAERVLEGDIVCRNWDIDSAKDGRVRAGVFESTPGLNRSIKGETWEFCLILSGVAEITEDGQPPGDLPGRRLLHHEARLHRHLAHARDRAQGLGDGLSAGRAGLNRPRRSPRP